MHNLVLVVLFYEFGTSKIKAVPEQGQSHFNILYGNFNKHVSVHTRRLLALGAARRAA